VRYISAFRATDTLEAVEMQRILDKRVVPVAVIDKVEDAVPLAEALLRGGLDLIEVTFRTAAAADAIRAIVGAHPEMLVGAGTVLTGEQLERARDAGAAFAVAPGLNEATVRRAQELRLPFVPGVMTPSEIERALALGCRLLKFFPAEAAGGLKMLKALAGPFAHTGVRFLPLGGVSPENMAAYLADPLVAAVGGTWIADKKLISAGRWDEIAANAADAARRARPGA
jgi:2-dehydro-3-deoxyphosphogluconate aldolase/(4S)-4-hydroxy-2-oxoglutarate aldolase